MFRWFRRLLSGLETSDVYLPQKGESLPSLMRKTLQAPLLVKLDDKRQPVYRVPAPRVIYATADATKVKIQTAAQTVGETLQEERVRVDATDETRHRTRRSERQRLRLARPAR